MSKIKLMRKNNSIYIYIGSDYYTPAHRAACMQISTITNACSEQSAGALHDDDDDGTRLFVQPAQE
jgi:hypothetical protein